MEINKRHVMGTLLISFIFIYAFYGLYVVYADDENENGDYENERGSDFAEGLGVTAIMMLFLGSLFVILKRLQVFSKLYLKGIEYEEVQITRKFISRFYREYRKPAFYLHAVTTFTATIVAALHGWLMGLQYDWVTYFGGLAVVSMIIMSLSGIVMWLKFWPLWEFEETKTMIKWIHRQWFFTGLMSVGTLIHFIFAD